MEPIEIDDGALVRAATLARAEAGRAVAEAQKLRVTTRELLSEAQERRARLIDESLRRPG